MSLRCKKPRPLTREEKPYRDARLFVIATEDTYAPNQYFQLFRNTRIKVLVLPTEEGLSAPQHVLERLDRYIAEYDLDEDDERWLMLDTDHWIEPNHIANFRYVCADAIRKGFQLAHSNSCFEVWLLLHLRDLDPSEQFNRYEDVVDHLRDILGGYSGRNIDYERFTLETAADAARRAEELDQSSTERWPQKTGSHVYRVVKKLLPK